MIDSAWEQFMSARLEQKLMVLREAIESCMLTPLSISSRRSAPSRANWWSAMADDAYAKFRNDNAVPEIRIGIKVFKCIGVSPPQDHPHIYLDMGDDDTIRCPYCATLFRFDPRLGPGEADPPDCLFIDELGE
jgi:uncharacterized Zn-finger protein